MLAPLTRFDITSGEDLYLKTKKIDWTHLMTLDQTFAVGANVSRSVIDNSHFAALKVKDVVADMFRARYRGKRPNVDTKDPDLLINVHIRNNTATVAIDCSGSAAAPPRLPAAGGGGAHAGDPGRGHPRPRGWDGKQPLYDPMCGSGTLLSEAWLKAGHLPANVLRRKFGFMMLPDFNRNVWVKVKFTEDNRVQPVRGGLVKGSDIDPRGREHDPREQRAPARRRRTAGAHQRFPRPARAVAGRDRLQSALRRAPGAGHRHGGVHEATSATSSSRSAPAAAPGSTWATAN